MARQMPSWLLSDPTWPEALFSWTKLRASLYLMVLSRLCAAPPAANSAAVGLVWVCCTGLWEQDLSGLINPHDAGSDEGAFAWLTLNYLLGFLGKDGADTMAAIDLGGGSVQEAFALTDTQAKAAPDPLSVTKLKGGGRTYSVYVHRFV